MENAISRQHKAAPIFHAIAVRVTLRAREPVAISDTPLFIITAMREKPGKKSRNPKINDFINSTTVALEIVIPMMAEPVLRESLISGTISPKALKPAPITNGDHTAQIFSGLIKAQCKMS